MISKKSGDFFPPLSKTELNDTIILPIIPPNSNQKIYCSYVYHNDKYHKSTAKSKRDEYRLYMNVNIDPNRSYFHPKDIVVFNKIDEEQGISVYQINLFREGEKHYNELNQLIVDSSLQGGHGLISHKLDYILYII